jgi:hypothetical protein
LDSKDWNLDSRDRDFWEREFWRDLKWVVKVVNSWVQEDRMVFRASRSLKNFCVLSVSIANSVAIDWRRWRLWNDADSLRNEWSIEGFQNPKP